MGDEGKLREKERKRKRLGDFERGENEKRKMGEVWLGFGVGDQRKRKEEAREQKWLLFFGREFFFAVEAFVGQQPNNLCEPPSLTLSLYFSVFFFQF